MLTDIQLTGTSTGFGAGVPALLPTALSAPVQLPRTGAPCGVLLAGRRAGAPGGAMPAVPAASFAAAAARPVNPAADRDADADLGTVRFRTAPPTTLPTPVPTTPQHSTLGYHSPGRPQS